MTRRRLRFEQLERRLLLAGDVKAALSRGDLIVTGDNNRLKGFDEAVEITYLEGSTYRVTGLNGTTVEGNAWKDVSGVTRNIIVDMKTGNDAVSTLGTLGTTPVRFRVAGNLTVKGGTGIDVITIKNADIVGTMTVDGGSEANTVVVETSTAGKDASIKGLAGIDTITLEQARFLGKLTLDTGAGNDTVVVDVVNVGQIKDVSVKTGDGNDVVTITNATFLGKLTLDTGAGNDRVVLDGGTVSKDASVQTGTGDDDVTIEDTKFLGKLTVNTGVAVTSDVVLLTNIQVGLDVSLTTGSGNDQVWAEGMAILGAGRLTVDTGGGIDKVGVLDSAVAGNITISTGDHNDQIGLLRVTTAGNLTVNGGNGDWRLEGTGDWIGLAAVTATNVTLDGGDGGTRRTPGLSQIGVTGSTIKGNLTIRTGNGIDQIGIGIHDRITERLKEQLIHPRGKEVIFDGAVGRVKVENGIVSISSGNYSEDYVAISDLTAKVLQVTMGPKDDTIIIGENVRVTQDLAITTGAGNDTLTVVSPIAFVANLPARRRIDGGTGSDTLVGNPIFVLPLDAAFRSWENLVLLV